MSNPLEQQSVLPLIPLQYILISVSRQLTAVFSSQLYHWIVTVLHHFTQDLRCTCTLKDRILSLTLSLLTHLRLD